ncbi:calcium-binding protein [Rhizobium sp. FKL33]|uniref:calcium-binding protein n=1 Tax=Rhizobium sp. FKL33 TaxID=2562307 RepID=UPI001484DA1A|nr:calcium-binding protein [Rhizobium sp. FKL33]
MPLQIINTDTKGLGLRVYLGTTDDVFVMKNATVGSVDDDGISGTGSGHRVAIHGDVVAESRGVVLGGAAAVNLGQEIIVNSGALVYGSDTGVSVIGYETTISNAGLIASGYTAILLEGVSGYTVSTISNSGTIESYGYYGIKLDADATEKLVIENSGLIKSTAYALYDASAGAVEELTNTGRIHGKISFGGGDDLYDGTSGRLSGRIYGGEGDDRIFGGVDSEVFFGDEGDDTLHGYGGDDYLLGGEGADQMEGGKGHDAFDVSDVGDVVVELAGQGTDLVYSDISYTLTKNVENLTFVSSADIDGVGNSLGNQIVGHSGSNTLKGLAGRDVLLGNSGADRLEGGAEADKLTGGAGADKLYGGAGSDQFIFTDLTESTFSSSGRDTIFDFSRAQGDKIVLSSIDANDAASDNQAFSFIGASAFSGDKGELRYTYNGSKTLIQGDDDGDGAADFAILLSGKIALTSADFAL